MSVYWLLQTLADLPPGDDWLAPSEAEVLASLRFEKRRRDWRLGRWTAKQAIARARGIACREPHSLADLVVATHANGAPYCVLHGCPAPWPISISHSGGRGLCAIAPGHMALGCDLERVERRTGDFVREWFTSAEQETVAGADPAWRDVLVTVLWSAKESALKAVGAGLTVAPDDLMVAATEATGGAEWHPFRVHRAGTADPMHGWWSRDGSDVMTLVTVPASARPVPADRVSLQGSLVR